MNQAFDYLGLTLVPLAIGMASGGLLGYIVVLVLRRIRVTAVMRCWVSVLPWRTVVIGLAVSSVVYPLAPMYFGLGTMAAKVCLTVFTFVVAFALTLRSLLIDTSAVSSVLRLVGHARTLSVVTTFAAIYTAAMGSGGPGSLIMSGISRIELEPITDGMIVVVLVSATIDIVLGMLSCLLVKPK
ncbi:MAG: hypothetical protein HY308_15475 [Gammaproteobacteria bacterium]|nr:hypothetical protein [Gammaproteobacteria bacterium]